MKLERTINVHPVHFGPDLLRTIHELLYKDAQGSFEGDCHIVAVTNIDEVRKGTIIDETGFSQHVVVFRAIVLLPLQNQVIDVIVELVSANGIHCSVGPAVSIFIPEAKAEAYHYEADSQTYVTDDGVTIEKGDIVRTKIFSEPKYYPAKRSIVSHQIIHLLY